MGGYGQWLENNQVLYNQLLATNPSNAFYSAFTNIIDQLADLMEEFCIREDGTPYVPGTDPYWECPCGDFIGDPTDMDNNPMCDCSEYEEVEWVDDVRPVELEDSRFFKDVSWTLSYDPKIQGWISFHDWHPELTMPSLNHFLTTKSLYGLPPECPPA